MPRMCWYEKEKKKHQEGRYLRDSNPSFVLECSVCSYIKVSTSGYVGICHVLFCILSDK